MADDLDKDTVPISEGTFIVPENGEKPYLVGSRCHACGEVFFPARKYCRRCAGSDLKPLPLSRIGKLLSFTTVWVKPPVANITPPYWVGIVRLPEGEMIRTRLKVPDASHLHIDMEMQLVIEILFKNAEGKNIAGWKFEPVLNSNGEK